MGQPVHAANPNPLGFASALRCTSDPNAATSVPGWTIVSGNPALRCTHSVRVAWPKTAIPRAVLASGPYGASVLERVIPLRPEHGRRSRLTLSAWFSTSGHGVARSWLSGKFLGVSGENLGRTIRLGGVARPQRHVRAHFVRASAAARIPSGATALKLHLHLNRAGAKAQSYIGGLRLEASPSMVFAPLAPPRAQVPRFDHVFMIMMENTDYRQLVGDTRNAPYLNWLATQGTLLANYHAVYHPSDENYLAIAGGATFVRGPMYFPHIHVTARNLGDLLQSAGKSWKAYEQGMGTPCNTTPAYDKYYEPDDAPFINFTDIRGNVERCRAHLVDIREWPRDLRHRKTTPDFAWIAADDYDDGEVPGNGSPRSLRVQDKWLRRTLQPLFRSPAWQSQRSLLIITWDESDTPENNHVATIVLGSRHTVRAHYVSRHWYDHYSTARTIEAALRLPSLTSNDRYASPFNDAFVQKRRQ